MWREASENLRHGCGGISGSRDKYEYNIGWEAFVLNRIIPSSVIFPVEYGFVPQTWFDDEDPLDIMA